MKKMLLISFIIILFMIFTACGHDCIDPLPPGPPDDGSEKLLEDGKLYMENEEYDIAVDCFIQVLDIRPENYEAILSLERIFRQTIKQKDLELSQKIYDFFVTLHSDYLDDLQLIFEEYDRDVLDTYRVCLADAFFSDDPIYVNKYDENDLETYSSSLEGIQDSDVK